MIDFRVYTRFLGPEDLDELLHLRRLLSPDWEEGRQGTGYKKYNVKHFQALLSIQNRMLHLLDVQRDSSYWDNYFLLYPNGAYIPPHLDEASIFGKRHVRINVLLNKSTEGGELWIAGRHVELSPGDAVFFSPDIQEHEVKRVSGERLMFTVGAWV